MDHPILLPAAAVLVIALAPTACAGDGVQPAASTSAATTRSATPSESSTGASPTENASPTPAPELEDGRHFGYIDAMDPTVPELVFDLAYLLTGDEANQAAAEHGDEVPVPNDYYVVNDVPRLRTLAVAPDVDIFVLEGYGPDLVPGEVDGFVEGFDRNEYEGRYHGSAGSYWIVVRNGLVVRIEEQYFP